MAARDTLFGHFSARLDELQHRVPGIIELLGQLSSANNRRLLSAAENDRKMIVPRGEKP